MPEETIRLDDERYFVPKNELRHMHQALLDALWLGRYGERLELSADLDEQKMQAIQGELHELLIMYGQVYEHAEVDRNEERIAVTSGYGAASGRPYVNVEAVGQIRPTMARQLALWLLEVAVAAEDDAVVMRWMQEQLGLDRQAAGAALIDLRKHREAVRAQDEADPGGDVVDVLAMRAGVRTIRPTG